MIRKRSRVNPARPRTSHSRWPRLSSAMQPKGEEGKPHPWITFARVVRKKGARSLYLGLTPALACGFSCDATKIRMVVKVRLQMNNNARRGAIGELQKIAAKEGVLALWKGVGPAMARAGALTASQLATYDEFKQVKF
ncbi:mitochondrial substrate carrier family protein UcpB isoform X3 [Tanacetum coccineum]